MKNILIKIGLVLCIVFSVLGITVTAVPLKTDWGISKEDSISPIYGEVKGFPKTVIERKYNDGSVDRWEIGLREDGIVVWRKIGN